MTNHERHYRLWNELARTGGLSKYGAFISVFDRKTNVPYNFCFACQEALLRMDSDPEYDGEECDYCPIDWGTETCTSDGSPYENWVEAESDEERKYWARVVRDLPWK